MPSAVRTALAALLLGLGGVVGIVFTAALIAWLFQLPLFILDAPVEPEAWSRHLHSLRYSALLALLGWCACLVGARVSRGIPERHRRWLPIDRVSREVVRVWLLGAACVLSALLTERFSTFWLGLQYLRALAGGIASMSPRPLQPPSPDQQSGSGLSVLLYAAGVSLVVLICSLLALLTLPRKQRRVIIVVTVAAPFLAFLGLRLFLFFRGLIVS